MATGGKDDQELAELLNELRVLLPGVQVLFAFLLTVPFSQRFGQLSKADRNLYFAALLCAAGASAALIAPSIHARVLRRGSERRIVLAASNPLALVGSALLAAGIACAVYLIGDVVYRSGIAATATVVVVVIILVTWYGIPIADRVAEARRSRR